MANGPISFGNQQSTGQEVLTGAPGVAVNVMVDQAGAIRRRPGIAAAPGVTSAVIDSTGISGLYATVTGDLYAVGNTPGFRRIYKVGPILATPFGVPLTDATLAGFGRPTFAETQLILAIAGGANMQKVDLAAGVASRLGGDPPFASHVIANSSRLLGNINQTSLTANFDRSVVRFSAIANGNTTYANMEVWTEGLVVGGAGHFSAEANPDPVVGIYENTNEVFCFGPNSLQIFAPDGAVSDTGIPAGWSPSVTKELGCSAPHSVIKLNQQFAWLDNIGRFVMSDGRNEAVISDPIQRTLEQMDTTQDCFGYRIVDGPLDTMVWTFPTDGRTFAFQKGAGWAEWLGWSGGNYAPLGATCANLQPYTHTTLVGTASGRIGRYTLDAQDDFGEPINFRVETGYINRNTDSRKHCRRVNVALRRGTSASGSTKALLSWRDQPGAYGAPIEIELGALGDTEIVVQLTSLGVYRRRQWRFEYSGAEDLALVGMDEEYDVLAS